MKSLGCIRKTAIHEQLLLLVVFLLVPTWGVAETTATRLAGLPKFVGLGLKGDRSGDINWMVDSGTPWTYRYGYLSGAVNSSGGWATWVSPEGEYATQFMNTSSQKGYIPVISYYTIVQSAPNASVEPPFANLANASTMKAYFQDFRLLMKKAHIFGKPVIVHVEPDLWGYIQGKTAATPQGLLWRSPVPEIPSWRDLKTMLVV